MVQIIGLKKFAVAALDVDNKTFIIHIAYLGAKILIYLACKAQIALLMAKKLSF